MKKIVSTLIIFAAFSNLCLTQNKIFLFPEPINLEDYTYTVRDSTKIKNLQRMVNEFLGPPYMYVEKIETYDFNRDGIPEYMVYYNDGGSLSPFFIYRENNGEFENVGEFEDWFSSFAKIENGMPQIIWCYYEGEKTNPIYYARTFIFRDNKYQLLHDPHLKLGDYRDLGLQAYKNQNLEDALIYFTNVLRPIWTWAKITSADYNNLALVYIKMEDPEKAILILEENLKNGNKDDITYYNLGLIEEKKRNYPKAIEYYEKSNRLKPMKVKMDKIEKLKINR
jgi:tetratricopeptide (TPR) repeat protein